MQSIGQTLHNCRFSGYIMELDATQGTTNVAELPMSGDDLQTLPCVLPGVGGKNYRCFEIQCNVLNSPLMDTVITDDILGPGIGRQSDQVLAVGENTQFERGFELWTSANLAATTTGTIRASGTLRGRYAYTSRIPVSFTVDAPVAVYIIAQWVDITGQAAAADDSWAATAEINVIFESKA